MSDSATQVFLRSTLALFLRFGGLACSFLFSFLLARLLGAQGAGTYFLAATIISLSTIVARMGLDNTLLRMSAVLAKEEDWPAKKTALNW